MTEEQHFTMPSNPNDRKRIRDALYEMSGALQVIDDKREFMKDVAKMLEDEFQVPKKISAKMARTLHKNNYQDVHVEADQFSTIFETLFQGTTSADEDEDEEA